MFMFMSLYFKTMFVRFGPGPYIRLIMHESFVITYVIMYSMPCYRPQPQGEGVGKRVVKTMLFVLPFAIENLPGGKDLNIKTLSFPLYYRDIKIVNALHFSPAISRPSP